jgi:lysozyme family protein
LGKKISVDGGSGALTIAAINSVNESDFYNKLKDARKAFYQEGADKGWFNPKYLTGLIDRVESFPDLKKKLQSEEEA